jgi:opacity protein-like surface antigen
MKKHILIIVILLLPGMALSQESITLSGGYSFADPEKYNTDATGFRITGTYEIGPFEKKRWQHGLSFGYVLTEAPATVDVTIRTLPFYYAPKLLIGSGKVKAFVRGALGIQWSRFQIEAKDYEEEDRDWGFYGGLGFGGMIDLSEKVFINLEYEWAYMSNTYYDNGMLNTVQLGLGFRL